MRQINKATVCSCVHAIEAVCVRRMTTNIHFDLYVCCFFLPVATFSFSLALKQYYCADSLAFGIIENNRFFIFRSMTSISWLSTSSSWMGTLDFFISLFGSAETTTVQMNKCCKGNAKEFYQFHLNRINLRAVRVGTRLYCHVSVWCAVPVWSIETKEMYRA